MKTIIAVTAALLAAPAIAQDAPSSPAPTVTAPTQSGSAAKAKDARYCVKSDLTGSRIQRKTCRTRAEWMAEGFDPLKADK